jgi:uncharacterized protein YodC (DUF2158 family)
MADFKVGDVVQLKSGGPKMTVIVAADDNITGNVATAWFVGDKQESGEFPAEALRAAEDT